MDYIKTIDILIETGTEILTTKYTKNELFAQLSGQYVPVDWVDSAKFDAWKTRITTFLTAHFDQVVVDEYTAFFKTSGGRNHKPDTVNHVIALLQTLATQIENKEITSKKARPSLNTEYILSTIFNKFHRVSRQLRTRHDSRSTLEINDEYDVQDLLHAILSIHFDDIRDEEWTPSYAGGCLRTDFLLKNEKVVIEVKKTRQSMTAKKLGEELIIDIEKYQEHPYCEKLFCFVYDPEGRLGNPTAIMNDLNNRHKDFVTVIIRPQM